MKTPTICSSVLAAALLIFSVSTTRAQSSLFTFDLLQQMPGGITFYGGFGSFTMDAVAGEFEVDVVYPYDGDSFTPEIITPSGNLAFSLGTGNPTIFRFGPIGDLMYGIQYTGTLDSSSAVFADMMAGRGEIQLATDFGLQLTGLIIQPVPEPGVVFLFASGLVVILFLKSARATKKFAGRFSSLPAATVEV